MSLLSGLNPFAGVLETVAKGFMGQSEADSGGAQVAPASSAAPARAAAPEPKPDQRKVARRRAISAIESGGRYDAIGPKHPTLGRAIGKYQVMEANIGPWTEKHLGRRMTTAEYLRNEKAQDAVFDGEFDQYARKHGEAGAAQAWFAGEGGVGKLGRKDSLGTSVGSYGDRFMAELAKQGYEDDSRDPAMADGPKGQEEYPRVAPRTAPTAQVAAAGEKLPPGSQELPTGQQRGGRGSFDMAPGSEAQAEQAGVQQRGPGAVAYEHYKVNRSTRRLRGLSPAATLSVIMQIGADSRAAMKGQPSNASDKP